MTVEITKAGMIPGNHGKDGPGNGKHRDENGNVIECCCDECDYLSRCFPTMSDDTYNVEWQI